MVPRDGTTGPGCQVAECELIEVKDQTEAVEAASVHPMAGLVMIEITAPWTGIFDLSAEGRLGSSESRPDTAHTITVRYTPEGQWQMIDEDGATAAPAAER